MSFFDELEKYKEQIKGVSYNSKTLKKGDAFVCITGVHVDGHNYAKMALVNGASVIVAQKELKDIDIPVIVVEDTKLALAQISDFINESPSKRLNLIGVTGTNGKTTVTHLIQKIIEKNDQKCGLIGTLGQKMTSSDGYCDAKHTTPQAPELQATLKKMLDSGMKNVVMEVSSHSLEQYRVGCCQFDGAVFTNLTQDHLDYHITMKKYFEAKTILFKNLKESAFSVINNDDKYALKFNKIIPQGVKKYSYSIKNSADFMAQNIDYSSQGVIFECKTPAGLKKINLKMAGEFSVYNALAALTAGVANGVKIDVCIEALEETQGVAGRFETIVKEPLVIVDYAHTPDGLKNVLLAGKKLTPKEANLICVFGAGGDRDATKRPQMGQIADKIADKIIITSDNPRSEDPQQIITDVLAGVSSIDASRVFVEPDRGLAIKLASKIAQPNDVVILAGKGHEDYQILKDKTIHFDDREEVRKVFSQI